MDLVEGHIIAIGKFDTRRTHIYNLGIGKGYSVLNVIKVFSDVSKRHGDPPTLIANAEKAKKELNWSTNYTMEDICTHFWKWLKRNPNGYNVLPYLPPPLSPF
eukprot:TRINITY_DN13699_c0_g1_i1.p1 TRINITY_DN13699_c0_g1~~TRINITY_DN13699_c0_g1_i1.p1  ORF type:complete len:103 (+),score=22.17 TRINITY_DN13699_c0_g1_i1:171-479(+)